MYLLLSYRSCRYTRISQFLDSLRKPETALRVSLYAHNCRAHTAPCSYPASSQFHFLPEANLLRAPTPRAIVSRPEEEMENRQKDIDPLVTPVSSTEQHQTGLTFASFWNRPPAFRLQPVH